MDADERPDQTDFDSVVSAKQLRIMKAAIPYIPTGQQRFISVYVKLRELMNTFELFNQPESEIVSICSAPEESRNPAEMLNAVKGQCNDREKEMLDLMFNFISASSLYRNYRNQNSDSVNAASMNPDLLSSLKKMLSPEQQAMFETYSSILGSLS
jgi:hypothetical protein